MTRLVLALCLVPALAHADDKARATSHLDEVLWAETATCDKGDDTQRRQCKRVRDAWLDAHAGALLLVEGEAEAFEIGAWNAAKKTLPLKLAGCIRCKPIDVDGKKLRVMPARGGALYDEPKAFPDEAAAVAWAKLAKNRRVEVIVKLPAKRAPIAGGAVALEVTGYRVIAACDGSILVASPPSPAAAPDPKACGAP
jgi:hypothetical protein